MEVVPLAFCLLSVRIWSKWRIDWTFLEPVLESSTLRWRSWLGSAALCPPLHLPLHPLVLPSPVPLLGRPLLPPPVLPLLGVQLLGLLALPLAPLAWLLEVPPLELWLLHLAPPLLPPTHSLPLLLLLMAGRLLRAGPRGRARPPSLLRLIFGSLLAMSLPKRAGGPTKPLMATGTDTWPAFYHGVPAF